VRSVALAWMAGLLYLAGAYLFTASLLGWSTEVPMWTALVAGAGVLSGLLVLAVPVPAVLRLGVVSAAVLAVVTAAIAVFEPTWPLGAATCSFALAGVFAALSLRYQRPREAPSRRHA
jgi:hypothetical protein